MKYFPIYFQSPSGFSKLNQNPSNSDPGVMQIKKRNSIGQAVPFSQYYQRTQPLSGASCSPLMPAENSDSSPDYICSTKTMNSHVLVRTPISRTSIRLT